MLLKQEKRVGTDSDDEEETALCVCMVNSI